MVSQVFTQMETMFGKVKLRQNNVFYILLSNLIGILLSHNFEFFSCNQHVINSLFAM